LAALIQPPEGGGELVGGDTFRDPFPLLLEAAVVHGDACQLVLHALKQEVGQCEILESGQVAEDLDVVGSKPILNDGSNVDRGVVTVEKPMLLSQNWPLLSEMPYEDVQDLHDVHGIDGGASED
jgi:hypothetical protein